MLDSDLGKLYKCKNGTKSINLAANINKQRFPEDFCFQLTKDEYNNLRFQIETTKMTRPLPYVFTEQGVVMLSSVLKTKIASKISIDIMRAFVSLRKYISNELLEQQYVKNMLLKHDNEIINNIKEIKLLQQSLDKLQNKELIIK